MSSADQITLVLVTGPSGAGRSSAINALEELEFETIDNLPISLIDKVATSSKTSKPLAIGLDIRNRDFSIQAIINSIAQLKTLPKIKATVLFVDCDPKTLNLRFSETRRKHPFAPQETIQDGIAHEIELLNPIKAKADLLIDTSDLTPHELRAQIKHLFDGGKNTDLAVILKSFSYKKGLPVGADMVLDVRFLKNPHWEPALRAGDGRDQPVQDYVVSDPSFTDFFQKTHALILFLLPAYKREGKTQFTLAFGCTGGRHRSVTLVGLMAQALEDCGWNVLTQHMELDE